jgi:hypothetical protein
MKKNLFRIKKRILRLFIACKSIKIRPENIVSLFLRTFAQSFLTHIHNINIVT